MKIEDFENFEVDWYKEIDLTTEQLFDFIIEYKSIYDVANKEYVVKIKLWNGLETIFREKLEKISEMGQKLNNINVDISMHISRVLHIIKMTKEYEKDGYTDIKKWAEDARNYQKRHIAYTIGK